MALAIPSQGQTESRASAPATRHRCFVSGYGFSHTVSGANREPGFSPCDPSSLFRIRIWLHPPLCSVVAVSYQGIASQSARGSQGSYQGMASAVPSQAAQRAGLQPLRPVIAVSYQGMASAIPFQAAQRAGLQPLRPVIAVSYQGMASAIPFQAAQRAGLQPL